MPSIKSVARTVFAVIPLALLLAAPAHAQVKSKHVLRVQCWLQGPKIQATIKWPPLKGKVYVWRPRLRCVVYKDKKTTVSIPSASIADVDLDSSGTIDGAGVCGLGLTTISDDNPTVTNVTTTPFDPSVESTLLGADLGYVMTTVGGQGALYWSANGTSPNMTPFSATQPVGGGVVNIAPSTVNSGFPGSPPDGTCTDGLEVTGAVDGTMFNLDV